LAGYSFGGVIAFEMAKQLAEAGKKVKLLAMFDTYAYPSYYPNLEASRNVIKAKYSLKKALYTFVLLAKRPKRTLEYKLDTLKRMFLKPYLKLKYGKERQYEMLSGHPYQLGVQNAVAEEKYRLTPQQVIIDLFRVSTPTYYMHDFEFLGWKPFALKGINIHQVPGEHAYIFDAPNDKNIAEILQRLLDK